MATLRDLIDAKAVDSHDTKDVFNHLKKVKDAQTRVDLAKTQLHQKIAPARQLIQMVDQMHPMPGQNQQFDENGNLIPQMGNGQLPNQMNPNNQDQSDDASDQVDSKPNALNQAPNTKKPLQQNKGTSTKSKTTSSKSKSSKDNKKKGSFEVHIKGEGNTDSDRLRVKKMKTKKRFDFHDGDTQYVGSGRTVGVNFSRKIKAGGQGSGRHKSSEPVHKGAHTKLTSTGYRHIQNNNEMSQYRKGNNQVFVHKNGSWAGHSKDDIARSGEYKDLHKFLKI
jgi:hypothetical protein